LGNDRHPRTLREAVRLPRRQALVYDGLSALARLTRVWDTPARANGDLEEMTFFDKVYWLHKTANPVRRAVRGSGLEAYFARPKPTALLPASFEIRDELRLSAAGDLMPHPYLEGSARTLYAEMGTALFDADLVMGNLECVVAERPKGLQIDMSSNPVVGMEPPGFDIVANAGGRTFDFMATACNHSLDLGEAGVASTLASLRRLGIAQHGLNERDEDAERATIVERGGLRIAIVAHTFGLNAVRPPAGRPRIVNRTRVNHAVATIDFALLDAQLRDAARARADFTIVQLHWGLEFELYPRPEQLEVAHAIAERGADVIVGHHPHVLQPMELYRTRRDPDRLVPIWYSLGNLTNPFAMPFMCRSGVARITLARGTTAAGATKTYVRAASTTEVEQVADDARRAIALRVVQR
jgi:poly-gamma-glutamate synthesis protein (capsule biosynthesis protein)